jgi:hypothetical protein
MSWLHYLAWSAGGVVPANAMPHSVGGVTGRAFQTPFAGPPRSPGLPAALVGLARGFGRLHGGDTPTKASGPQ